MATQRSWWGSMYPMVVPVEAVTMLYHTWYLDLCRHLDDLGHSTAHITLPFFKRLVGLPGPETDNPTQDATTEALGNPNLDQSVTSPRSDLTKTCDNEHSSSILFNLHGIDVADALGNVIRINHSAVTLRRQDLHKTGHLYELWVVGYRNSVASGGSSDRVLMVPSGESFLKRRTLHIAGASRPVPAEGDAIFLLYAYLMEYLPKGGTLACSGPAAKKPDQVVTYEGFIEFLKRSEYASHPLQSTWLNSLEKKIPCSIVLAKNIPLLRDCKWLCQGVLTIGCPGSALDHPFSATGMQSCISRLSNKLRQHQRASAFKRRLRKASPSERAVLQATQEQPVSYGTQNDPISSASSSKTSDRDDLHQSKNEIPEPVSSASSYVSNASGGSPSVAGASPSNIIFLDEPRGPRNELLESASSVRSQIDTAVHEADLVASGSEPPPMNSEHLRSTLGSSEPTTISATNRTATVNMYVPDISALASTTSDASSRRAAPSDVVWQSIEWAGESRGAKRAHSEESWEPRKRARLSSINSRDLRGPTTITDQSIVIATAAGPVRTASSRYSSFESWFQSSEGSASGSEFEA